MRKRKRKRKRKGKTIFPADRLKHKYQQARTAEQRAEAEGRAQYHALRLAYLRS